MNLSAPKLLLFLCVLSTPSAWAQTPPAPPAPAEAPAVASPRPGITIEQARARITALETASEVDEPLLALYRQLVQRIEAEVASATRTEVYRQLIDIAPAETARVREELARKKEAPPEPIKGPPEAGVEELQQQLTKAQGTLAELSAQRAEFDRLLAEQAARTAREDLVAARTTLAQIQTEIDTGRDPGPDSAEAERVTREILRARKRARGAEIAMLEQELLSRPVRLTLLEAQREMALWSIARAEERVAQLQTWLSDVRKEEANRARQEAERARREAETKGGVLRDTAAGIEGVTKETQRIIPKIDTVREKRQRVEGQLARTKGDYELTTRSLELGIGRELGAVLLELRRNLPSPDALRRDAGERSAEVAEARLRLFYVERELEQLAAVERVADEAIARAESSPADPTALRTDLLALLTKKRTSLDLLRGALDDYLNEIKNLDVQESALIERADELFAILAQRLIWIPNAPPIGQESLERLGTSFAWLFSTAPWSEAGTVFARDSRQERSLHALAALAVLTLLLARRRMARRLAALAAKVGRVRDDRIVLTVTAAILQVLYTLPIPAALIFVGWRLEQAATAKEHTARAIGSGLIVAFVLALALQLVYDFSRKHGVARAHFHWSERTTRLLRRHLIWFVPIALATTFVVGLGQAQAEAEIRYGLGRLGFVVLMLATGVLAYLLLHPARGLFVVRPATNASIWMRRSRPFWMPLGVLMPLSLVCMAAAGYYYAALQLEERLNQTLLILTGGVFVHAFALRWLKISQRRLALKVAVERRAALAKKSGADEAQTLATDSMMEALGEIDVAEIREQTQDLVRASIGILIAVAIWFAWVGVLPALGVLDTVTLWHHTVVVEGVTEMHPITLANLGLSLLAIVIMITAARNMPGFLEIVVLQRLPLEQGVRYATRTLVLYAIVATGTLLAFTAIGIGWSSVQWLVAALTVGLGFGLQEIFANFVSGLIILLERPIRVGDTVTVGEISGVVTRIRMRATTITDWKRRELVVPNKSFITGQLINWSLSDPILRLEFLVGIAYGSDTKLAHKTMLDVCRAHPLVLDSPEPNVFFVGFGDNSLNFEVRVFVTEPTNNGRSRIVHDLHMSIDQACRDNAITIAFPQRDLHIKSSDVVWRVAVEPPPAQRRQPTTRAEGPALPDENGGAATGAFRTTALHEELDEPGGH